MDKLIRSTTAYAVFSGDKSAERLSHAYLLYFADGAHLREALKQFALLFFGCDINSREGRLVLSEGLADMKIYPKPDKKLTVDAAAEIIDDAYLQPVEGDKKLYIISGIEEASALFQNKLLKILEEPPKGVYFLLGATSLAPVLSTVLSRVKKLEIPPFSQEEIFEALERESKNPLNLAVSQACGGSLGVAENMLAEGFYAEVRSAAQEICTAGDKKRALRAAIKYGGTKYKSELLSQMQRTYFAELQKYADDGDYEGNLSEGALIYAIEGVNKALADVKFNANFPALLYDLTLRVASENEKWLKQ